MYHALTNSLLGRYVKDWNSTSIVNMINLQPPSYHAHLTLGRKHIGRRSTRKEFLAPKFNNFKFVNNFHWCFFHQEFLQDKYLGEGNWWSNLSQYYLQYLGGKTTRGNLGIWDIHYHTITNVVFGCGHNQSFGVLWGGWNCWFRAKHFLSTKPLPRNLC